MIVNKKYFWVVVCTVLLAVSSASAGIGICEASGKSEVAKITVFIGGAEVTRTMPVELSPGKNTATFVNLPADVSPESVAASVSGGADLISATFRVNHLENPVMTERIEKLTEELKSVREEIERNSYELSVLDAEEEFLKKNSGIGGTEGIRLEDLRGVAEYYRARLSEISSGRLAGKRAAEELKKKADRIAAELGSASRGERKATGEIIVELAAQAAGKSEVSVSYFVRNAGWTPFYEIRVADLDGPARLVGKGKIIQNTGEDWDDVPITLSSGRSSSGGTHPELQPWYLDFYAPPAPMPRYRMFNTSAGPGSAMNEAADADMVVLAQEARSDAAPKAAAGPVAQQGQTSVEFILPAPVSVPSGGEGYTAETMNVEMPAKYEHYSVRKMDMDVFLLAKIEGWEKLNVLAGEAGIFLGNTYVGKSFIDPRRADDTMEISLGRDSGVIVTRVKGRDFAGKSLLGTSNKTTREWVITVRNARSTPIDIRVLDQIPVSANKEIKVEAVEISGATLDTDKGELRWNLTLKPGESVQKTVKYSVTYPKDKNISLE